MNTDGGTRQGMARTDGESAIARNGRVVEVIVGRTVWQEGCAFRWWLDRDRFRQTRRAGVDFGRAEEELEDD